MTEHDVKVAGDIGEMKADMRTVKHDLASIQQGMIALGAKIDGIGNQQARGLGFFAGMGVVVTAFAGILLATAKLLFGGIIASGRVHP
jgi:hypothetical protein